MRLRRAVSGECPTCRRGGGWCVNGTACWIYQGRRLAWKNSARDRGALLWRLKKQKTRADFYCLTRLKKKTNKKLPLWLRWQKCLPTMQETWVRSPGQEDPLEKEMATHSSILAWKIPWTEEPGRLQSMGSQRVAHDWVTSLSFTWPSYGMLAFPIKYVCSSANIITHGGLRMPQW